MLSRRVWKLSRPLAVFVIVALTSAPALGDCPAPAGTYGFSVSWEPTEPKACPGSQFTAIVLLSSTEPVQGLGVKLRLTAISTDTNNRPPRVVSISAGGDIPGTWLSAAGECSSSNRRQVSFLAAPDGSGEPVPIQAGSQIEVLRVVIGPEIVPSPGTMPVTYSSTCTTSFVAENHIVVDGCDVLAPDLVLTTASIPISTCGGNFRRGDCNNNGIIQGFLGDLVFLLLYLFAGGSPAPGCLDACDANDDGAVNVTDATYLATWMFRGGPPPALPYPNCGADLTPNNPPLTCADTICP